jgi:hypothetical protein
MDLVIYGVPAAVVIIAVVQLAKNSGLSSRWAAPLAVGLGLLLATAFKLDSPAAGTWLQVEMAGLLSGLAAAGLYSGQKAVRG